MTAENTEGLIWQISHMQNPWELRPLCPNCAILTASFHCISASLLPLQEYRQIDSICGQALAGIFSTI